MRTKTAGWTLILALSLAMAGCASAGDSEPAADTSQDLLPTADSDVPPTAAPTSTAAAPVPVATTDADEPDPRARLLEEDSAQTPQSGNSETAGEYEVTLNGSFRYIPGALFGEGFKVIERGSGSLRSPIELSIGYDTGGMVDAIRLRFLEDLMMFDRNFGPYEGSIESGAAGGTLKPVEQPIGRGIDAASGDEFVQAFLGIYDHSVIGTWLQLYPPGAIGDGIGSLAGQFVAGQPTDDDGFSVQGSAVYVGRMSIGYIGSDGSNSLAFADARVEIDVDAGTGRLTTTNTQLTAGISEDPIDASTLDLEGTFAISTPAAGMSGNVTNAGDSSIGASELTGDFDIAFYGPDGIELAGTVELTAEGVETLSGAFGLILQSN